MKKAILFLALLVMTMTPIGAKNVSEPLSAPQKAYIVSKFCTEVKYNFVHYDKLTFDWDSLCMAQMPMLVSTKDDAEFVKGLKALNARLQDGHTYIVTQRGWNEGESDNWIKPFPMTTRFIEGRVVVDKVESKMLRDMGVTKGCEILRVDGEDVKDYCRRMITPYVNSSTPQWSDYRTYSGYEVTKAPGKQVSLVEFKSPEGKIVEVKSDRNSLDWDLWVKETRKTLEYRVLDGNIGYLKVSHFRWTQDDKKEFLDMYRPMLKTDALIVDLRDNGGGNSLWANFIVRFLCDTTIVQGKWRSPKYVAAHASWGRPKEWHEVVGSALEPIERVELYSKPVVVLISERTFSSAENFCVSFRNASRGKLIGTTTGGSSGNPIIVDLGYGVKCAICTREEFFADGTAFNRIGIKPDIEVDETIEDFVEGNDVVLQRALDELEQEK